MFISYDSTRTRSVCMCVCVCVFVVGGKIKTPETPYVRSKLLHGIIMVFKKRFPGTKKTKRARGKRNVPCSRGFNLGAREHTYVYTIPSYAYNNNNNIVFASKVRSDNKNLPSNTGHISFSGVKKKKITTGRHGLSTAAPAVRVYYYY